MKVRTIIITLRHVAIAGLMLISSVAHSQDRSGRAYAFLDLPTTARETAIGGQHATIGTTEAGLLHSNPAALTDTMRHAVSLSAAPIASGIFGARASYAHHVYSIGTFGIGFNHIGYGTMDEYDIDGNRLGTFGAGETAISLTYSRPLTPHWQIGATLKPIFSTFANYSSAAIAMDMGVRYTSANELLTVGAVLSNLGAQIKTYHTDANAESLYHDLRVGLSYKAEHAPLRFTLTFRDLLHWDQSLDSEREIETMDNVMRHVMLGLELMPIRNFFVGVGYNHRMRKELRESDTGGAAGISWGFGLRIKKIDIAYGCGKYHAAGANNVISISTDIQRFL